MKCKRWLVIILTLILALALVQVANADVVQQFDIVGRNDPVQLIPGDAASYVIVNFRVNAAQNDGDPQCNIDPGEIFTIGINPPPGIIAEPPTLTFPGCGVYLPVKFSATETAVPGAIAFAILTNTTGTGTYTFNQATFSFSIVDVTPPVIIPILSGIAGNHDWYVSDVTVTWQVTDAQSAITSKVGCDPITIDYDTHITGRDLTCTATSAGGTSIKGVNIKVDKTPPVVSLVGGPEDGSAHYFAFVPPAPTYDAYDATSGLAGDCCTIIGYSTLVGSHVVTALAEDLAGNMATDSAAYTVKPWEKYGFYMPVDMGKWNGTRAGAIVPLKFELFAGPLELTDLNVVRYYYALPVACDVIPEYIIDEIEILAEAGETILRYSTAEGRYLYNWQTPSIKNACYKAIIIFQDGERLSAYFKLR